MKPARTFDGAAAWRRLTADQQRRIGALALELAVGLRAVEADGCDIVDNPADRACDAAVELLMHRLEVEVRDLVGVSDEPLVPSLLGDWCRVCGCSQHDACPAGCGWASPGLCSACAPRLVAGGRA